ncbi:MAG: hypothetical protein KJ579_07945 [Verrucomicrobia bacterium]|nr:hypothetical protein [Verrucomicrobiota bacterium]
MQCLHPSDLAIVELRLGRPKDMVMTADRRNPTRKRAWAMAAAGWALGAAAWGQTPSTAALSKALALENLPAVRAAVADLREALGARAGEPEAADRYTPVPSDAELLSPDEARRGFTRQFAALEARQWWKTDVDPTKLTEPLRVPASFVAGNAAIVRAKLDGAKQSLAMAREAAEFLMKAQRQAGSGVYPFPAARGTSKARAMEAGTRLLAKAEKAGDLDSMVRHGWIFDDLGDGGLQFDNGECGSALLDLYDVTNDARYLASARRAADWAAARPLCPNWNYNSFSVHLLARTCAATGDAKYLESAVRKARIGVIPGQLVDGPRAGRWVDPHNARPAYHYIMLRALAQLAAVMPPQHANREEILRSLALGLKARNTEILRQGVMNRDKALEALLRVRTLPHSDDAVLRDTQSDAALGAVGRLVSAEARGGGMPLGPGEWGLFLEYCAGQPAQPAAIRQ